MAERTAPVPLLANLPPMSFIILMAVNPHPLTHACGGTHSCIGPEIQDCNMQCCIVNGTWSDWSVCNATCGTGSYSRYSITRRYRRTTQLIFVHWLFACECR